jgi:general secretion pathway protein F
MPAFEYQVLDAGGRKRKGVAEGDNARAVRARLRQDGLTPLAVEEVREHVAGRGGLSLGARGISPLDLALATRQMATLARAGLPVEEILGTVARQTEKARIRSVLTAVRTRVMEGHALATAMAAFPACSRSCIAPRLPPANSRGTWISCWNGSPTTPRTAMRCARKSASRFFTR